MFFANFADKMADKEIASLVNDINYLGKSDHCSLTLRLKALRDSNPDLYRKVRDGVTALRLKVCVKQSNKGKRIVQTAMMDLIDIIMGKCKETADQLSKAPDSMFLMNCSNALIKTLATSEFSESSSIDAIMEFDKTAETLIKDAAVISNYAHYRRGMLT